MISKHRTTRLLRLEYSGSLTSSDHISKRRPWADSSRFNVIVKFSSNKVKNFLCILSNSSLSKNRLRNKEYSPSTLRSCMDRCGVRPNKCWQGYSPDQSSLNFFLFSQFDLICSFRVFDDIEPSSGHSIMPLRFPKRLFFPFLSFPPVLDQEQISLH
jgi:hypothetical protein